MNQRLTSGHRRPQLPIKTWAVAHATMWRQTPSSSHTGSRSVGFGLPQPHTVNPNPVTSSSENARERSTFTTTKGER